MRDVRAIVAIGRNNQMGLDGNIPWRFDFDKKMRHIFKLDMKTFYNATRNSDLIAGTTTYNDFVVHVNDDTMRISNRRIFQFTRSNELTPEQLVDKIDVDRPIFIIGGAQTYKAFAHLIKVLDIVRIPYDGPADTYFPDEIVGLVSMAGENNVTVHSYEDYYKTL